MSYFGTSGPESNFGYSIAAGYARRGHQINARRSAPLGNIGNIAENAQKRLTDAYDERFTPKYGDPLELKEHADDYSKFLEEHYIALKHRRHTLMGQKAKLEFKEREVKKLHAQIAHEFSKDPAERDMAVIKAKSEEATKLEPSYNAVNTGPSFTKMSTDIANNKKELSRAETEFENAEKRLNEEFLGNLEDYFVDGPLVHERKAMGLTLGGVGMGLLIGAFVYYGFLQGGTKKPRLISGNKSAAMAVYG